MTPGKSKKVTNQNHLFRRQLSIYYNEANALRSGKYFLAIRRHDCGPLSSGIEPADQAL
jgi:hypothetical protein